MSPFNKTKYGALLKGLEISEIKFSKLNTFETFRCDAEYFQKQYITDEVLISRRADVFCKFNSYGIDIDCSAFYPSLEPYYNLGNIPFIRVGDVKTWIDYDNCIMVPQDISYNFPTLKLVTPGDIVITKGGSIGRVGFVLEKAYASRDILFLKSSVLPRQQQVLLYFYLTSDFASRGLLRSGSQIAQPHITLTLIKNLDILRPDLSISKKLTAIFDTCLNLIKSAGKKYRSAEQLLVQALCLDNWQPTKETIVAKTFAEVQTAGRLDAEYYQPKYDELFKHLGASATTRLKDIVSIKKSIEPGSDAYQDNGIPFIRVSDVSKFGITQPEIYLDRNAYFTEDLIPKKDTILLSKDGSVGIAYKVEENLDAITSGALLHLTVRNKDFLPDYLTLVLNSTVVGLQAERDAGGSIIQHWKPSEIENVVIPKLPMDVQRGLAAKVQESFALRKESKRLLDLAKRAVELAIEQGEAPVFNLLEES